MIVQAAAPAADDCTPLATPFLHCLSISLFPSLSVHVSPLPSAVPPAPYRSPFPQRVSLLSVVMSTNVDMHSHGPEAAAKLCRMSDAIVDGKVSS